MAATGARIRHARETLGLTQDELSKRVGISRMYLSRLETDARGGTVATLRAIARALGMTLDDLVADDGDVRETIPG